MDGLVTFLFPTNHFVNSRSMCCLCVSFIKRTCAGAGGSGYGRHSTRAFNLFHFLIIISLLFFAKFIISLSWINNLTACLIVKLIMVLHLTARRIYEFLINFIMQIRQRVSPTPSPKDSVGYSSPYTLLSLSTLNSWIVAKLINSLS